MAEGVLTGYDLYLNHNEAGEHWGALLGLEYRDLQALALRRVTTNKVRGILAKNAEWSKLAGAKQDIRKEGEGVLADAILPR